MRVSVLKALEKHAAWLKWLTTIRPDIQGEDVSDEDVATVNAMWQKQIDGFKTGETIYMNEQFCRLVDHARRTVPDDLTFENSWIPCENGFLYLETPFSTPVVPLEGSGKIAGVGWGPVPGFPGMTHFFFVTANSGVPGNSDEFSFWSHCSLTEGQPVLQRLREFEDPNDAYGESAYMAGKQMDELHEIRWLYTALHLMSQRLTIISQEQTSPLARSVARGRGRNLNPSVRVVSLRRMEYDRQQEQGEHSSREYHWQWLVTGHWRRQPYRDGTYKNVFIEAYVKGPQNMPLKPPVHKVFFAGR